MHSTCLLNSVQFHRYIIEIISRIVSKRVRNTTREYSHVQQDSATRSRSGANLIFRCNRTSWTWYISGLRARLHSHVVSNGTKQAWHNWDLSVLESSNCILIARHRLIACPGGIDRIFLNRLRSAVFLFTSVIIKYYKSITIYKTRFKISLNKEQ